MKRILLLCLTVLTISSTELKATDDRPWYGRVFELDVSADCLFQTFTRVNTTACRTKRSEFDTFFTLDASMALWESIAAEIELTAAETKKQSCGLDSIRLTGRYLWWNDVKGDLLSVSTGFTFAGIFPAVRRNIATFEHGGIAGEATLSIGKEAAILQYWTSHAWTVVGIGLADVGSPWIRWNISWEHNWWERHRLEILIHSIWGLGNNRLNLSHFRGYGSVHYQAIDLGARYYFQFDSGTLLSFGYGYRVFSRNAPENASLIFLKAMYPF